MPHYCTLIPGDGIGPEVAQAAVRAVESTGVDIVWRRAELNEAIILEAGKTLPQYLLDSLNETRVGLKGPVTTPVAGGFQSVNVALRKALDLFANVRPVKTLPGIKTRFQDVVIDMVIFRENTEDLYSGLGARDCQRRGHQFESDYSDCLGTHCALRIQLRAKERPQNSGRDS